MKILIPLFLFSLLTSCGESRDDDNDPQRQTENPFPQAGRVSLWSRSGGYDAAVFLSADYGSAPLKKYPMILSLHGFNGSVLNSDHTDVGGERTGFIKQVWDTPLALSYPAIVIAPDVYARDTNENSLWDHEKLRSLIFEAFEVYQVDPQRITVTGHSAGALAAQELALKSEDLIAGIMPGAFEALIKLNLCSVENLPIWSFGNSNDPLYQAVSWREVGRDLSECPNYTREFTLSVYENTCGHGCWDQHWERADVQNWLVNQVKSSSRRSLLRNFSLRGT